MADAYTALAVDDDLRRALRNGCGIPTLVFLRSTDSTQRRARELAVDDGSDWTLVVTDYQTAGRGQHGRRWSASAGTSVMFSLIVRPPSAEAMAFIPIRTGLAATRALEELLGIEGAIRLKWPNDLMVGESKLAGILCEGQIRGDDLRAIVGVGINVHPSPPQAGVVASPAFLDTLVGRELDRLDVLSSVVAGIRTALDAPPPALTDEELGSYAARDWLAGRDIVEPIAGRVVGLDARGHLVVRKSDGMLGEIVAGSVRLA
jgi:BirA family transcriptional regulator, biotin operon repressor / biotin---[acetyl-CoA-carboxylase] ligase